MTRVFTNCWIRRRKTTQADIRQGAILKTHLDSKAFHQIPTEKWNFFLGLRQKSLCRSTTRTTRTLPPPQKKKTKKKKQKITFTSLPKDGPWPSWCNNLKELMLSPIAISDYFGAFEKIFPIVIVPVTSLSFAEIVPFNNVRTSAEFLFLSFLFIRFAWSSFW